MSTVSTDALEEAEEAEESEKSEEAEESEKSEEIGEAHTTCPKSPVRLAPPLEPDCPVRQAMAARGR